MPAGLRVGSLGAGPKPVCSLCASLLPSLPAPTGHTPRCPGISGAGELQAAPATLGGGGGCARTTPCMISRKLAIFPNNFQLHKRLSGSLWRPLPEAPHPCPRARAGAPGEGAPQSGPSRPAVSLASPPGPPRLTWKDSERGVRPAESSQLLPNPEIPATRAPRHQEGARSCQAGGSASWGWGRHQRSASPSDKV